MTTDKPLMPCPHDKEARIINIGGRAPFSVYLGPDHACHRDFGWFATRAEAIAAWNNRMEAVRPPVGEEVAIKAICRERCAQVGDPPCFELSPTDWNYHSNMDECGCDKIARAALLAMQSNG
jgi:hypothetical protein